MLNAGESLTGKDFGGFFESQEVKLSEFRSKDPKQSETRVALYHALRNQPISTEKCIFIPAGKIESGKIAISSVAYAKRQIIKAYPALNAISFKTKTVKDEAGAYLGLRVWRIN